MKTKPIITGLVAIFIIFITLPSCQKEPAGSDTGLSLQVQAINKTFSIPSSADGGPIAPGPGQALNVVQWEEAAMMIARIELEAEPKPPEGGEILTPVENVWYGPEYVDLFNMKQFLGRIPLPPGEYKEIEFTVIAQKPDAENQSVFYLSGTYMNAQGKTFPMVVDITDELTMVFERFNVVIGTVPEGTNDLNGQIKIGLEKVFSKILPGDLDEAATVDGTILISKEYNTGLYLMILENLRSFVDSDPEGGGSD